VVMVVVVVVMVVVVVVVVVEQGLTCAWLEGAVEDGGRWR